jgi:hypothetical protein
MRLIQDINHLNQNNWILRATLQAREASQIGEEESSKEEKERDSMMIKIILMEVQRNLSEDTMTNHQIITEMKTDLPIDSIMMMGDARLVVEIATLKVVVKTSKTDQEATVEIVEAELDVSMTIHILTMTKTAIEIAVQKEATEAEVDSVGALVVALKSSAEAREAAPEVALQCFHLDLHVKVASEVDPEEAQDS